MIDTMTNKSLEIRKDSILYEDNVFSGIADINDELFKKRADDFRNSKLMNYDHLTKEQREELAQRWENAANLPEGKYDYYFNLEDKYEVFVKSVEQMANVFGIKYKLTIK